MEEKSRLASYLVQHLWNGQWGSGAEGELGLKGERSGVEGLDHLSWRH